MHRRLRPLSFSFFFVFIAACEIPERPRQVTISHPPVFRPANTDEIKTVEQALAAVITVCRDDLHLPVVDPLQVYLYKNQASLAFYGHGWQTLPVDIPHELAFARGNTMHINLQAIGDNSWAEKIGLLAHEYGHTIQNQISSKHIYYFVDEGFGEWVAAKVLDVLRWQDYSVTLHRSERELARQRNVLPDIQTLSDSRLWKRLTDQRNGTTRTYTLAFLVINKIIREKGLLVFFDYLRTGNGDKFLDAVSEYVDDFRKISAITSNSIDAFSIDAPEWKVGYRWTFNQTRMGQSSTEFREIVGEDTYRGRPIFVIKVSPDAENLYDKDSVLLALRENGKIVSESVSREPFYPWPLQPGKESTGIFGLKDVNGKISFKLERSWVVIGFEQIHVPAGTFKAIKLETFEGWTGAMLGEYWYAPEVKWFVKRRLYAPSSGVTEDELIKVELKATRAAAD